MSAVVVGSVLSVWQRPWCILRVSSPWGKSRVAPGDVEPGRWYRLAADEGDTGAQFNLGLLYPRGEGVPQDHREAARWYRLAAEQGHGGAQNNLGVMYSPGEGVAREHV